MSATSTPIPPSQFSQALQDLPLESLYAKTHELNNSIAHLQRSNAALQEYSDSIKNDGSIDARVRAEGDQDCIDAIRENEVVIARQRERVVLIKGEVERRGQVWHEREPEGAESRDGDGRVVENGNGDGEGQMGTGNGDGSAGTGDSGQVAEQSQTGTGTGTQASGRLTDEELRRQVESLYPQDGADDDGGMHL